MSLRDREDGCCIYFSKTINPRLNSPRRYATKKMRLLRKDQYERNYANLFAIPAFFNVLGEKSGGHAATVAATNFALCSREASLSTNSPDLYSDRKIVV